MQERDGIVANLAELPRIEGSSNVDADAVMAQRELAKVDHHRPQAADLIIAACAHKERAPASFTTTATTTSSPKRTVLEFESEWLALPGSL